jgi:alkylhydroperoxidase family enzyme
MPRIQPLLQEDADTKSREIFDQFKSARGNIPNMFRTMALRPDIMSTAVAHMNAIYATGTVARKTKELVTVRVSQINDCAY